MTIWEKPSGSYHAHWDCFSGAAGDMMLAACLDASGDDAPKLLSHVQFCIEQGLPELKGEFSLQQKRVWKSQMGSIAATYVTVTSRYHHAPAPIPTRSSEVHEMKKIAPSSHHSQGGVDNMPHDHGHSHKHEHSHSHGHSHSQKDVPDVADTIQSQDHDHEESIHPHSHRHEHSSNHASSQHNEHDTTNEASHLEATHFHNHHHHQDHGSESHDVSHASHGPLRNLPQIRNMLMKASFNFIPNWVRIHAIDAFTELAKAEAMTHGAASMDDVHFHEVGAIDSIVDTVGTLLALDCLGVRTISCSRIPLGEGTVWTDHGLLPVPAPATLRLLVDMPTCPGPPGITGELVTPTAAALLKILTKSSHDTSKTKIPTGRPCFTLRRVGIGAGTKDYGKHPNIIRLMIGDNVIKDDRIYE